MIFKKLDIEGCYLIEFNKFIDSRGTFVKTFHSDFFSENGIVLDMREEFYSISAKNVIRGMHFQMPPAEHDKLVYCVNGAVLDVILDIRKDSKTYGEYFSIELSYENSLALWVPKGLAHGFLSLADNSIMFYKTSSVHNVECDSGIKWNSFGFKWPIDNPIISEKDNSLCYFDEFDSSF
ncbi:dTDP-4-dehydrorhamnose 3,5-epimerase [Yersinia pseudotuberculosis]|nr:dTDP-4-dehydrorhamnose 3,5-epimerase [Yersinia pseudotuberculosis]CNC80240.1 putative epimerase [Yersinia pseudotuberculosis]